MLNGSQWQLSHRVTHYGQPIFKLKAIAKDRFVQHLPKKGTVDILGMNLSSLEEGHQFSSEIQAI